MGVLQDLVGQRKLFIRCPECEEEFPASRGRLFDATKPFPDFATDRLAKENEGLRTRRAEIKTTNEPLCVNMRWYRQPSKTNEHGAGTRIAYQWNNFQRTKPRSQAIFAQIQA